MNTNSKFHLQCKVCGYKIQDFSEWFSVKQKCPKCGSPQADVMYNKKFDGLLNLIKSSDFKPDSLWGYFDYLPLLDNKNIISAGGEGIVPIDRWTFFEKYAQEHYNCSIKVYAHRHDRNFATGTFKDLAGTVVASVLKENGIKNYVSASTGNIGVAYARYLAAAGISLTLFIPNSSLKSQEAEVTSFGQKVYRVDGDYAAAKKMAKEYAEKHNFVLTGGNFDPMRIEAKKTMVYEWLRLLPDFPTVFMQAISGGSGPLGIAKSCKELESYGVFKKMPRFILPQPHRCAPMAEAWDKAKAAGFPEGWEKNYPIYEDPKTTINTLATGNPTAYPPLAKLVKESNGEIIASTEENAIHVSKVIAYETTFRIGPAAAITVVGFFDALRKGYIKDGDVVMLNIGEGTNRSALYMEQFVDKTELISNLNQTKIINREDLKQQIWKAIDSF